MASWPDLAASARARIAAEWPSGGAPVVYENENNRPADAPAPFLLVEIVPGGASIAGFGGGPAANLWLETGSILLRAYVPRGQGAGAAWSLLETALALFRDRRLGSSSSYRCTAATPAGLGSAADDGNYWQAAGQVAVTWYRAA